MPGCNKLRSERFKHGTQQHPAAGYLNGATAILPRLAQSSSNAKVLINLLIHDEQHYPIFDRICCHLRVTDIFALRRTCKRLSNIYHVLLKTQWNVNRGLCRFVRDPYGLRSQLGRHDALISGSFALQFFERVTWKESDLDIFIEDGPGAVAFGKYLLEVEGYRLVTTWDKTSYPICDIEKVETYTRSNGGDARESQIQIICTTSIPVQAILRGFYTTAVVNLISWNRAYALFPLPTFVHHKTYLLKEPNDYFSRLLLKYSQRGWRTQDVTWPEERTPLNPFRDRRRVGDRYVWRMSLDTTNVEHSITPDFVLELAQFSMQESDIEGGDNIRFYNMRASIFEACTLRYRYTCCPSDKYNFWFEFVGPRMDRLTVLEFLKMEPKNRPPLSWRTGPELSALHRYKGSFELPSSWDFFDDELSKWYKVWEQLQSEKEKKITS